MSIWTNKYRPQTLDDIILSKEVRVEIEKIETDNELNHLLFYGPAGTGKTSLAKIIIRDILKVGSYLYINASDERGIDAIRDKIKGFAQTKSIDGNVKIILLDEADALTCEAQRALRNIMDEYIDNVRFILTANYKNMISSPIKSRVIQFSIVPTLKGCISRCVQILQAESVKVSSENIEKLQRVINNKYPDLRSIINHIQRCVINNELIIPDDEEDIGIINQIFDMIIDNSKTTKNIREFIIKNEVNFSNNYLTLLKQLFDRIYESDIEESKKAQVLVTVGEYMYKHQFVMDFEINAYCCILQTCKELRG